jgi:alpha/beta superfamily hydrolase
MTREYREEAALLGERRSLVAILARPALREPEPGPAIVFLNTGIIHRTGHNRMYVTLARQLASSGRLAVRFDLSGIGDSLPRGDGAPPVKAAMDDIRMVLDWLQQRMGARQFTLVGLCSGADHAMLYCPSDERITGLVLLDPSVPPTARYYYYYVLQRLTHPRSWLSVITGRSGLLRMAARHIANKLKSDRDVGEISLENLVFSPHLRRCYTTAVERGVRMLAIFTSVSARHSYYRQILDAFPAAASSNALRLEYFQDSDHVFSSLEARTRLNRVVLEWLGLGWR